MTPPVKRKPQPEAYDHFLQIPDLDSCIAYYEAEKRQEERDARQPKSKKLRSVYAWVWQGADWVKNIASPAVTAMTTALGILALGMLSLAHWAGDQVLQNAFIIQVGLGITVIIAVAVFVSYYLDSFRSSRTRANVVSGIVVAAICLTLAYGGANKVADEVGAQVMANQGGTKEELMAQDILRISSSTLRAIRGEIIPSLNSTQEALGELESQSDSNTRAIEQILHRMNTAADRPDQN